MLVEQPRTDGSRALRTMAGQPAVQKGAPGTCSGKSEATYPNARREAISAHFPDEGASHPGNPKTTLRQWSSVHPEGYVPGPTARRAGRSPPCPAHNRPRPGRIPPRCHIPSDQEGKNNEKAAAPLHLVPGLHASTPAGDGRLQTPPHR